MFSGVVNGLLGSFDQMHDLVRFLCELRQPSGKSAKEQKRKKLRPRAQ